MTPTLHPIAQALESLHPLLRATHYVLNVKALAESPAAAIATIGCVRIVNGVIDDGIYLRVDTESAIAFGGETDASTLNFWLRQSDEIRQEIHQWSGRIKVNDALMKLADFIDRPGSVYCENFVWGRRNSGATGNAIVATALRRAHLGRPWPPSNDRDLSTLIDLYRQAKVEAMPMKGVPLHALDDAMHEARILVAALKLHIARSPA